jgi:hypothetical protein
LCLLIFLHSYPAIKIIFKNKSVSVLIRAGERSKWSWTGLQQDGSDVIWIS